MMMNERKKKKEQLRKYEKPVFYSRIPHSFDLLIVVLNNGIVEYEYKAK